MRLRPGQEGFLFTKQNFRAWNGAVWTKEYTSYDLTSHGFSFVTQHCTSHDCPGRWFCKFLLFRGAKYFSHHNCTWSAKPAGVLQNTKLDVSLTYKVDYLERFIQSDRVPVALRMNDTINGSKSPTSFGKSKYFHDPCNVYEELLPILLLWPSS